MRWLLSPVLCTVQEKPVAASVDSSLRVAKYSYTEKHMQQANEILSVHL